LLILSGEAILIRRLVFVRDLVLAICLSWNERGILHLPVFRKVDWQPTQHHQDKW
jgi:hypothetical protein